MKKIFPFSGRKAPAEKKSVAQNFGYQSMFYNIGKPLWSGRNYAKFSDEAYVRNVIAHQSVAKIAMAAASVRFKVTKLGQTLDPNFHPLARLLRMPNPVQGGTELLESIFSFKLISGNSYILAVGAKGYALEMEVNAYSRASGRKELLKVIEMVRNLLDGQGLAVTGFSHILTSLASWNTALHRDGVTRHGKLLVKISVR